ncbi:amidohydrolase 2 [Meredithblackwellia eburnea MCA 4105]
MSPSNHKNSMPAPTRPLLIDVHTHVYLPSYMDLMRKRTRIPRVHTDDKGQERVILLKEEEAGGGDHSKGRPVGPQYWDRKEKIAFMDLHGIDVSVVSLANPWLDFLTPEEAIPAARDLNNDIEEYCATYGPADAAQSTSFVAKTAKRLFAFGSLPLVPGIDAASILAALKQIKSLPHIRGIVMGTKGLGKGLDDEALEPIWAAIAEAGLTVFIHPHYGVEGAFGEKDNGHVLPLALGFPFETTIAIARLILFGTFDRHPNLRLLLAHSAGALPALSSRLSSCVAHDPTVKDRLQHDFRYYLGLLWYDAVAYGTEELALVERVVSRAERFEGKDEHLPFVDRVRERRDILAPVDSYPGCERILFGTDHPFFPPLDGETRWRSVDENLDAITGVPGWGDEEKAKVCGGNAVELFGLEL